MTADKHVDRFPFGYSAVPAAVPSGTATDTVAESSHEKLSRRASRVTKKTFTLEWRGYSRTEVDHYCIRMQSRLDSLLKSQNKWMNRVAEEHDKYQRLLDEIDTAQAEPLQFSGPESRAGTADQLGVRVQAVLETANREAASLTEQARTDAQRVLAAAQERTAAREQELDIREARLAQHQSDLAREHEELMAYARGEAARIINEAEGGARKVADDMLAHAQAKIDALESERHKIAAYLDTARRALNTLPQTTMPTPAQTSSDDPGVDTANDDASESGPWNRPVRLPPVNRPSCAEDERRPRSA